MLYSEYHGEDKDTRWSYTEWRYFCACTAIEHVLCITIEDEEQFNISLSINSSPEMSLWDRIKNAISLLLGKEVTYLEVEIGKEDRKELAAVIAGTKKATDETAIR